MAQIIFNPCTENLQNALAAVVGRAITKIKRFATALHNKCNLVVYVDWFGQTCSQFIKKDAFTGYHFEWRDSNFIITNKETGDVYAVTYDKAIRGCTCPAFRFSRQPKQPCKHIKMVAELKGELEQLIAPQEREEEAPTPQINLEDLPKGCRLERSDDWISLEYYVHAWGYENRRGVRTLVQKNIGRLVQCSDGIHAYRLRSGVGHTFETTLLAIAYLVRIVGTSFKEIAQAFEEREARTHSFSSLY